MSTAVALLVDDKKTVLDALRRQVRTLAGSRLRCETAEHVDEAWEVLEELSHDEAPIILVVSDWLMPGTRGDEFLAQVRSKYPRVVRVMLTGQADAAALERVQRDDLAHLLLTKPWTEADVRAAIDLALGR
jgi:CheY-like chemotaxis protein